MAHNLKEFLGEFHRGIEVCVAGEAPDTLLGVREAFRRFFRDGQGRIAPIAVVPQPATEREGELAPSDIEAIGRARVAARALEDRLFGTYHFYLATQSCVHGLEVGDATHLFVRSWTVLRGVAGETFGSSGSIEVPRRLIGGGDVDASSIAVLGPRRSGGMLAALTGGLETRRNAVTESTVHALATQFYGFLEDRS